MIYNGYDIIEFNEEDFERMRQHQEALEARPQYIDDQELPF